MEFDEFVAARRSALVRAVVLMGSPLADAEDIVQTALTKCYRYWTKVKRAGSPEAYVYRILVTTRASARRRKWHGELPTDELLDSVIHPDFTTGIAVRQALVPRRRHSARSSCCATTPTSPNARSPTSCAYRPAP